MSAKKSIGEFRQQPLFTRYRPSVDAYIQTFLSQEAEQSEPMLSYHMGYKNSAGEHASNSFDGKGIRPTLALLTADALGGDWEALTPVAAALELFHNFTLIHDDIQDGDEKRHGKPTVWTTWSLGQGVNAGDSMSYISTLALLQLTKAEIPADNIIKAADRLTRCGIQVINGQIRDLNFEDRLDVVLEEYFEMISRKTGALLETSIMIATDLVDTEAQKKEHLSTFGKKIGRAFQISDDILGIWGDEDNTGKKSYGDIVRKKKSLPIILALNSPDSEKAGVLKNIYAQDKAELAPHEVATTLAILEDLKVKEEAEQLLDAAYNEAVVAAKAANLGWAEKDFILAASLLSHRNK
jgi:geranylgeranyl diphosphate synthase type I